MRPIALPPIGPRARKALKIAGYVLAGLISFVYAVHLTFPYDRLKDRGVEWLSAKYDVSVQDVERGWLPGDFSLVRVQLRSRPAKAGDPEKRIFVDRIDVDVGVLSALTGSVDVDIEAALGAGRIDGTISLGGGGIDARFSSRNLPLSDVPGLDSIIGMPMGGRGNVTARLDLPANGDWRRASARLAIDCPGCTVGGEGAFFKPRNATSRTAAWAGEGVPVPMLAITSLKAQWTIDKGKIKTDRFEFASPHLALELEFEANVEKSLKDSRVENACLRYRGTPELEKLDEKFYNALELTGGPLASDDLRHLKLVGTLGKFRALGKECGPGDDGDDSVAGDRAPEPRLRRPDLDDVPAADPGGAGGAGTPASGTIDPGTADRPPPGAANPNPDDLPTPQVDDVKPGPPGDAGADPGNGGTVLPPEGNPATREEAAPAEEAPAVPPPTAADSVQLQPEAVEPPPGEAPPQEQE